MGLSGAFLQIVEGLGLGDFWREKIRVHGGQFQNFTWQTHEIYHADFLMVVTFFFDYTYKMISGRYF